MSEVNNLWLWNAVEKTDPDYTKQMPGGSRLTSINGAYLVKKATEIFGPIGDKWGYEIKEERYDHGAPLLDENGNQLATATIHTLRLELWYKNADGERCSIEHFGHTDMISINKYGITTEHEPSKKSLTDALSKCLSMLGFGGDIHMGMYDDQYYVEELANKTAIEKSDNKAAEILRQEQNYREWKKTTLTLISSAVSINELEALFTAAIRKAKRKNDNEGIKQFSSEKDKAKERLQKNGDK